MPCSLCEGRRLLTETETETETEVGAVAVAKVEAGAEAKTEVGAVQQPVVAEEVVGKRRRA